MNNNLAIATLQTIAQWLREYNNPNFPNYRCADELERIANYLEDEK